MLSGEFQAMAVTDLSLRSIRAYRYDAEANSMPHDRCAALEPPDVEQKVIWSRD
jgi:hypothetical protein